MAATGGLRVHRIRRGEAAGTVDSRHAEAPAAVRRVLSTPGEPLPAPVTQRFAPLVGHRITDVRVHRDDAAGQSAQAVGARAYTVGRHVVFGPGQYDPGGREGDRVLAHELTHVAQHADVPAGQLDESARRGPLEVAAPDDSREREASTATAGTGVPHHRTAPQLPRLYRIGLGESIARFFGGGAFSDEELQAYLRFLDTNHQIEDDYDSDNKARVIVQRWKRGDSAYLLPVRRKILLIQEMISGFTGNDDERAILDLLHGATDAELGTILSSVGIPTLRSNFHFAESDELERLLATRRPGGGAAGTPGAPTTEVFPAETALALQERFRSNAESTNRLNCILIIRELAPQLFADDPELAARVAARLNALRGTNLKMTEVGRVMSELGLASDQAQIRFDNGNGSQEPTAMLTSAWDTIIGMVGAVQGWHVFGLAVFNGYHSVTVMVDNRADGPRVYWADQWRIDPGDDFHQEPGSVSGFRLYQKAGFDRFINEQTRRWWNDVHSPTSKCADRARARGRHWDNSCRWPATLHIWKFRSALEQAGGSP